jgi:hypothetical protein
MSGKLAMESVASLAWNQWQLCRGIGGNFRAEYANYPKYLPSFDEFLADFRGILEDKDKQP